MGFSRVAVGHVELCPGDSTTLGTCTSGKFVRANPGGYTGRAKRSGSATKG